MDVFELIKAEHRKAEELFSAIESADDPTQRYDYFQQIYQELNLHAQTEELVLYPAMREYEETNQFVEAAEEEHVKAKELLEEIKSLDPDSSQFKSKIKKLKEAVEHHVQEEENSLLPTVSECMKKKELQQLAQEFQQTKTKLQEDIAA
ncbi:hemerythrin domain-containing protein [Microseira wollei]|uniref:Hemerythrin HHE cation binding domain-containing protein n=1 Tax=Microseira wollei NIES-4236 TaxID=2530354 RepID=A0AAV3XDA7_9CYAN|nr:hemerythrin domain-containing protein [Microseira wollei]GET38805.1 hemerythrin HHE cation binding domain-containing protein [Microseira wollei NIES-4236]